MKKWGNGTSGKIGENETIIYYDNRITTEQEALLGGRNFRQYPTIQELSNSKTNQFSSQSQDINKEVNKQVANWIEDGLLEYTHKECPNGSPNSSPIPLTLENYSDTPQR